jgi:hypothetical protein
MPSARRSLHLTATTLLAAGAAGLLSSAPASADTVTVADATAQNVTAYASTSAWSRRDADGRYRLVVATASAAPHDAPVRSSSVPFDPDLGPTKTNGRVVIYSRCAEGSATKACDVYEYDVGARVERKVGAVSGRATSEIGPSYFKGTIAFGRTGTRGGLFVKRPGKATRRIWSKVADQTDLSATKVIARGGGPGGVIRYSGLDGLHARNVGEGQRGEEAESLVASPVLTRYRAFWLAQSGELKQLEEGLPHSAIVETVSVRSAKRVVRFVERPLAPGADAIAVGSHQVPELFSGPAGISRIDPPLVFGS